MASSSPPPNAKPFTAAITGLFRRSTWSKSFLWPSALKACPSCTLKCANSLMSAPATKALAPLPVMISTRTWASASASSSALSSSSMVARFSAFS